MSAASDLLEAQDEQVSIVVVGGASLNLLGLVRHATGDVDVIAILRPTEGGEQVLAPPAPLPEVLSEATRTVACDFNLRPDWMNAVIGAQRELEPPPDLREDLTGGLHVGLAGCHTLIVLKLYAAVDQDAQSVHYQDLLALKPTDEELNEAAGWVRSQDASPTFAQMADQVIRHVRDDIG